MAIIIQPALRGFTSGFNTTAPNDVVPVSTVLATGTQANIDAAIGPKGTGALIADLPDNGLAGGAKRGANAVDLQTATRTSVSEVAAGAQSVIGGGQRNTANGPQSVVAGGTGNVAQVGATGGAIGGGLGNNVNGTYGAIPGGESNAINANADHGAIGGGIGNNIAAGADGACVPGGRSANARFPGKFAYSSSADYGQGGAQWTVSCLKGQSVNGVAVTLRPDLAGAAISEEIPTNATFAFHGVVSARNNATGDSAAWRVEGVVKMGPTAPTDAVLVGSTVTSLGADAGAVTWTCALAANTATSNGGLNVNVTGAAGVTVRAHAAINFSEVDMA